MNEHDLEYPEETPQAGMNHWDLIRILALPLTRLSQGVADMFDQFQDYMYGLSEVHDAEAAARKLEKQTLL